MISRGGGGGGGGVGGEDRRARGAPAGIPGLAAHPSGRPPRGRSAAPGRSPVHPNLQYIISSPKY